MNINEFIKCLLDANNDKLIETFNSSLNTLNTYLGQQISTAVTQLNNRIDSINTTLTNRINSLEISLNQYKFDTDNAIDSLKDDLDENISEITDNIDAFGLEMYNYIDTECNNVKAYAKDYTDTKFNSLSKIYTESEIIDIIKEVLKVYEYINPIDSDTNFITKDSKIFVTKDNKIFMAFDIQKNIN